MLIQNYCCCCFVLFYFIYFYFCIMTRVVDQTLNLYRDLTCPFRSLLERLHLGPLSLQLQNVFPGLSFPPDASLTSRLKVKGDRSRVRLSELPVLFRESQLLKEDHLRDTVGSLSGMLVFPCRRTGAAAAATVIRICPQVLGSHLSSQFFHCT